MTLSYYGFQSSRSSRSSNRAHLVEHGQLAPSLELLDRGDWKGAGVLGPEAFDALPFLDLLGEYDAPHALEDR